MKQKILDRILKSNLSFIAFIFWLWLCTTTIMFLLYSLFLDNEPLKKLLE